MLISFDFFVLINLIVCGKYDMNVQIDTIPNNIFPSMFVASLYFFFLALYYIIINFARVAKGTPVF